jgi:hypothetical protein
MPSNDKAFAPLEVINPNKAWVSGQLDSIIEEWVQWNAHCKDLPDSPDYHQNTCSEAIKDGWENIRKHEVLREKTLVFLRNHFSGAEFILETWPSHPHESVTCRLNKKVPQWLHRLKILKASMEYVRVPDNFWVEKGKELVGVLSKTAPEKAIDIAASYLKNPLNR